MRAEATDTFPSKLEKSSTKLSSHEQDQPAGSYAHLVQTMVTEVTHGLLDTLRQGLPRALHIHRQWDPKHTPVLVVWNLDPFHELGHSPVERTRWWW